MCRPRHIEEYLRKHAHRKSAGELCVFLCKLVGLRNIGRHLVASTDQKLPERPEPGTLPAHLDLSLKRLHAEQNHELPRPSQWLQHANRLPWVAQQGDDNVLQPKRNPPRTGAAIGKYCSQKPHCVRSAGVTDRFNVSVFIDIDAGADRHALRQILGIARCARADERFGIGAHVTAHLPADGRQRTLFFEPKEKFHGAERRGGENHSAAGEPGGLPVNECGGINSPYFIAGAAVAEAAQRLDVHHSGFWKDARAVLFRQIQIAKVQPVFRAVAATHHAAPAGNASGSRRTFSAEIWIREGLPARLSLSRLEDTHLRAVKSMSKARSLRGFLQETVGRPEDSILRHTQHS